MFASKRWSGSRNVWWKSQWRIQAFSFASQRSARPSAARGAIGQVRRTVARR
jgi:hypothetical protein